MAGWYAARSALGLPLTAPVAAEVAKDLARAGVAT
jgi:hypothetical protein